MRKRRASLHFVLVLAGLLAGGAANAHDDLALHMLANGDSSRADWFDSLKTRSGVSCCDERDCRRAVAKWRSDTGNWWVLVNGLWRPVPERVILKTPRSIDGDAYVCMGEDSFGDTRHAMSGLAGPLPGQIYCFVPPDFGS